MRRMTKALITGTTPDKSAVMMRLAARRRRNSLEKKRFRE